MSPTKCSAPKSPSSSADLAARLCRFEGRGSFFSSEYYLTFYLLMYLSISTEAGGTFGAMHCLNDCHCGFCADGR